MEKSEKSDLRLGTDNKSKSVRDLYKKNQIKKQEKKISNMRQSIPNILKENGDDNQDDFLSDSQEMDIFVRTPNNRQDIVELDFFDEFEKDREHELTKLSERNRSLRLSYLQTKDDYIKKQESEKSEAKHSKSFQKLANLVSPSKQKSEKPILSPKAETHRPLMRDNGINSEGRAESESIEPMVKKEQCVQEPEFCNEHSHSPQRSAQESQMSSPRTDEKQLQFSLKNRLGEGLRRKMSSINMRKSNLKISLKEEDIRTGKDEDYDEHYKKKSCMERTKDRFKAFSMIKEMIKLFDSLNSAAQWQKFFSQSVEQESAKRQAENEKQFKQYKKYSYLIFICLLPVVIISYRTVLDQVGKIKSQSLEYANQKELVYGIQDVPKLLPVHHFTFFDAGDIKNRIRCEIFKEPVYCMRKRMKACQAKGINSINYEQCVIQLVEENSGSATTRRMLDEAVVEVPTNSTQFCLDHYGNDTLWTGELSNIFLPFYLRKYDCLQKAGLTLGRDYCNDYKDHESSWGKVQLYNCFQEYGVWDAKEYCDDMFGYQNDDYDGGVKLLQCYGNNKIPKGEDFCVNTFRGQVAEVLDQRIECFDEIELENRLVCETKYNSTSYFNFENQEYQGCILNLNMTIDQEFCDNYFPSMDPWQIDLKYRCYGMIDLEIAKNREYCELMNPQDSQQKYTCVEEQGLMKGGDFCYIKFPYDLEYDDLYQCLEQEGLPYNSQYCEVKYHHIEDQLGDEYNEQDKFDCYAEYGIENTDLNCIELRNTPRGQNFLIGQAPIVRYQVSQSVKYSQINNGYDVEEFQETMTENLMNSNTHQFLGYLFNFYIRSEEGYSNTTQNITHYIWILEEGWEEFMNETMSQRWQEWGQQFAADEDIKLQTPTLTSSYGLFLYWNETGFKDQQQLNTQIQDIYAEYELFTNPFAADSGDDDGVSGGGAAESTQFLTAAEPDPMSTKDLIIAVIGGIEDEFPQELQEDFLSMFSVDDDHEPTGYMISMMQELQRDRDYQMRSTEELFKMNNQRGKIGEVSEAYNLTKDSFAYTELMERELDSDTLSFLVDAIKNSDGVFSEIYKMYQGPEKQPMLAKFFQEISETTAQQPFYFGYFKNVMGDKPYFQYFEKEFQEVIEMDFEEFNSTIWGENPQDSDDGEEPEQQGPNPYGDYPGTIVTITLDQDYDDFVDNEMQDEFQENLSLSLNMNPEYIQVIVIEEGSTIITYQLLPCEVNCSYFEPEQEEDGEMAPTMVYEDYVDFQRDLMATNQIDFGAPIIGIQVEGGETIVKDGIIVADGYDRQLITRTADNADLFIDDDGVIIESIVWSSIESVEITSKIESYQNKAAAGMKWCARESGICVCPWGTSVAFGLRNQTKWTEWLRSPSTFIEQNLTEADFIQLDNTKPYKQVQFDYNVTECSTRAYDGFDPSPDEVKDCFCMNFVDEEARSRYNSEEYSDYTESEQYFIQKRDQLQNQTSSFCSNQGEICVCPDSNEVYLAYNDDTNYRLDGSYKIDSESGNVTAENRYAFICNNTVFEQHMIDQTFGVELERNQSKMLSCFCQLKVNTFNTASLQSKIMSANVYYGLFEKLEGKIMFMKLIEQLLFRAPGQTRPPNNKLNKFIREDLDAVIDTDCNGRNLQKNPGILIDEWIKSSESLQSVILDIDDLLTNSTFGSMTERDLANMIDSRILQDFNPDFQIDLIFQIFEVMGELSVLSDHVSEVRQNGGLTTINDIFDVLLNEGEKEVYFQNMLNKKLEGQQDTPCVSTSDLQIISDQITPKPSTQSLLRNFFDNSQDQEAFRLKEELTNALSEDCLTRNLLFEKDQFIDNWIKRSQGLQSIIQEVESVIDSEEYSFIKDKSISEYMIGYLLQDLSSIGRNPEFMSLFYQYTLESPIISEYMIQAVDILDLQKTLREMVTIIAQTNATGDIFQELLRSDDTLLSSVPFLKNQNIYASLEEKLKYQSILIRFNETISQTSGAKRGIKRFYSFEQYQDDSFMFEYVKQDLKDALSQASTIKTESPTEEPKCNLREAVDSMILNSFFLQNLIPEFEFVLEESGIMLFDKNSMDTIIYNELIDGVQEERYYIFKEYFTQFLVTTTPSFAQVARQQRKEKQFGEYEALMEWEQILEELIENTDEFKNITCSDQIQNSNESQQQDQTQLTEEEQEVANNNLRRRQLMNNNQNINHKYQLGTWLFEDSEQLIGQLYNDLSFRHFQVRHLHSEGDGSKVNLQIKYDQNTSMNVDFNYSIGNESSEFQLQQARENNLISKTVKNSIIKQMGELDLYPNVSCHFSGEWHDAEENPWIKIQLNDSYSVKYIKIFNIKNGQYTSLLEDSEILVGSANGASTKCASVGSRLPIYESLTFECKDENQRSSLFDEADDENEYRGAFGDTITIQASKKGVLVLCDIQVFAALVDLNFESELQAKLDECYALQDQCYEKEVAENKWNCLERYGLEKTAQMCSEIQSSTSDKFFYPLKNKYQCLLDPEAEFEQIEIPDEILNCLDLYFEYQVEQCLEMIENPEMGPQIPDQGYRMLEQDSEEFNSLAIDDTQQENRDWPDLINTFLCDERDGNTEMHFYTNPYAIENVNEIIIKLECEIFLFIDDVTNEEVVAVHNYFLDDLQIQSNLATPLNETNFFINKTDLNQQYFQTTYQKQMEYLNIQKSILYITKHGEVKESIENVEDFKALRFSQSTLKLLETQRSIISYSVPVPVVLVADPIQINHYGLGNETGYMFLKYPLTQFNRIDQKFEIKPENNLVPVLFLSEEQRSQQEFQSFISLKFKFTLSNYTRTYFGMGDVGSDLGGVSNIFNSAFSSLQLVIIILFFLWFVYQVKSFTEDQFLLAQINKQKRNLEAYHAFIVDDQLNSSNPSQVKDKAFIEKMLEQMKVDEQLDAVEEIIENESEKDKKAREEIEKERKAHKEVTRSNVKKNKDLMLLKNTVMEFIEKPKNEIELSEQREIQQQIGFSHDQDFCCMNALDIQRRLDKLDIAYGHKIPRNNELLDEWYKMRQFYSGILNMPFMELCNRVKQKVSFYNLQHLGFEVTVLKLRTEINKEKIPVITSQFIEVLNKMKVRINADTVYLKQRGTKVLKNIPIPLAVNKQNFILERVRKEIKETQELANHKIVEVYQKHLNTRTLSKKYLVQAKEVLAQRSHRDSARDSAAMFGGSQRSTNKDIAMNTRSGARQLETMASRRQIGRAKDVGKGKYAIGLQSQRAPEFDARLNLADYFQGNEHPTHRQSILGQPISSDVRAIHTQKKAPDTARFSAPISDLLFLTPPPPRQTMPDQMVQHSSNEGDDCPSQVTSFARSKSQDSRSISGLRIQKQQFGPHIISHRSPVNSPRSLEDSYKESKINSASFSASFMDDNLRPTKRELINQFQVLEDNNQKITKRENIGANISRISNSRLIGQSNGFFRQSIEQDFEEQGIEVEDVESSRSIQIELNEGSQKSMYNQSSEKSDETVRINVSKIGKQNTNKKAK